MTKLTQKLIALGTACMIAFTTTITMAEEETPETRPTSEKMIQHQRKMMEKRYSTMDSEGLMKRKAMLEKRIQKTKEEKQKQRMEMELEVINSIINK